MFLSVLLLSVKKLQDLLISHQQVKAVNFFNFCQLEQNNSILPDFYLDYVFEISCCFNQSVTLCKESTSDLRPVKKTKPVAGGL